MKPTRKQIWTIAYPILISLLMENMIGLTDTAFLGREPRPSEAYIIW